MPNTTIDCDIYTIGELIFIRNAISEVPARSPMQEEKKIEMISKTNELIAEVSSKQRNKERTSHSSLDKGILD